LQKRGGQGGFVNKKECNNERGKGETRGGNGRGQAEPVKKSRCDAGKWGKVWGLKSPKQPQGLLTSERRARFFIDLQRQPERKIPVAPSKGGMPILL